MKKKDNLFQLIHALTQSEKRFFTLFAERHCIGGKRHNYYILYDVLNGMSEYDEAELLRRLMRRKIKIEIIVNNLAELKAELYTLLLRAIRECREAGSRSTGLHESIADITFLAERGLYEQAREHIRKARQLAEKYEAFWALLQLFDIERAILYSTSPDPDFSAKAIHAAIAEIGASRRTVLHSLAVLEEFQTLYDEVFALTRTNPNAPEPVKARMREIINLPLLAEQHQTMPFNARSYRHGILAHAHYVLGALHTALVHYKHLVEQWEPQPTDADEKKSKKVKSGGRLRFVNRIEYEPQRYIKAVANYAGFCLRLKQYDNFDSALARLRDKRFERLLSTFDDKAELFQNRYYLELLALSNIDLCTSEDRSSFSKKMTRILIETEAGIKVYGMRINPARRITLMYLSACLLFCTEKFEACKAWINKAYGEPTASDKTGLALRTDILDCCRRLFPIVLLELGEDGVLEDMLFQPEPYIRQMSQPVELDRKLFAAVYKLLYTEPKTAEFKVVCKAMIETIHGFTGALPSGFFEISCWLESKIENVPVRDICCKRR